MEYSNKEARLENIENIDRLINIINKQDNSLNFDYLDCFYLVEYLNRYKNILFKENEIEENRHIVEGVDFTGLRNALHQFDENGIRGESGKWTIVRGGYDKQFEIHYEGYTVLDCVSDTLFGGYRPTPEWNETTEQMLKNIVSATYGIEQVKTISSMDELKEFIEGMDWRVEDCSIGMKHEAGWDLFKGSPAGEDFSFTICHNDNLKEAIQEISHFAYNFDVDEHIEMWIEARGNGVNGVPNTRELVEDAEDISKMLEELADNCNALNIEEKELYKDVDEPDICDD